MRAPRLLLVAALLALVSACAPKPVSVPTVTTPRFPEYVEPRVPPGMGTAAVIQRHARIWQFLQAGDLLYVAVSSEEMPRVVGLVGGREADRCSS